jgi:hypothetical protein
VYVLTLKIAGDEFWPRIRLLRQWTFDAPCAAVSDRMVLL